MIEFGLLIDKINKNFKIITNQQSVGKVIIKIIKKGYRFLYIKTRPKERGGYNRGRWRKEKNSFWGNWKGCRRNREGDQKERNQYRRKSFF